MDKKSITEILNRLKNEYPDAAPELYYKNELELLIAAILSAQCTDKQVNRVTDSLFKKYTDASDFANADITEFEQEIRSCGFYRTKAKNIIATANILVTEFDGRVPRTMDELTRLPGVGRKVANVVLSNAFSIPAIAVDTHVFRVSNRLGLSHAKTELNTEKQLMEAIPREQWGIAHHWLIFHGRRVCHARSPKCNDCALYNLCERNGMDAAV